MNKVLLIGRLLTDPQVNTLDNGDTVANLRLETIETHKDRSGELHHHTERHAVTLWNRRTEMVQGLYKDCTVKVFGYLRTVSREKDGIKKYYTSVVAKKVTLLAGTGTGTPAESCSIEPEHQSL